MTTWSYYRLDTGEFTGRASTAARLGKVPDGCGAIEGVYDRMSQRVDPATGEVVLWQSPRRAERQRNARRREVLARIEQLERSQSRAIREIILNNDEKARDRLEAIEAQIAQLRSEIG